MLASLLLPALVATASPRPAWILTLPEVPGRVYGLGLATASSTRALALRQAQDGAKADVLARLRANIKSDTQVTTELRENRTVAGREKTATASRSTTALTNVNIQTQATELPGLQVETTYLEEDPVNPTVYALAYLDVAVASADVRARLGAVQGVLAAGTGDDLRIRLHRSQVLKVAFKDLARLEDLFGLIRAGGAEPALGQALLEARLGVEKERAELRKALLFGLDPGSGAPVDAEVRGAVRTAFLQEGMGWTDQHPDLTISIRARGSRNGVQTGGKWWNATRNADFILAQGSLSLTLVDQAGQEYESTLVVAKGVGISDFQAETNLVQDYKVKVAKAVATWLADLGK